MKYKKFCPNKTICIYDTDFDNDNANAAYCIEKVMYICGEICYKFLCKNGCIDHFVQYNCKKDNELLLSYQNHKNLGGSFCYYDNGNYEK